VNPDGRRTQKIGNRSRGIPISHPPIMRSSHRYFDRNWEIEKANFLARLNILFFLTLVNHEHLSRLQTRRRFEFTNGRHQYTPLRQKLRQRVSSHPLPLKRMMIDFFVSVFMKNSDYTNNTPLIPFISTAYYFKQC
jgi:hypothetical protein